MLRTKLALVALVPAMALGYSACTGEADTEDQEAIMEEEAAIAAPIPGLIGTFRHVSPDDALALLVLKSDGTYHRSTLLPCHRTDPCFRTLDDDGLYTIWYRGGDSFMSLYPNRSGDGERYQWILRGFTLRLTKLGGEPAWTSLAKDDGTAWCGATTDCALQDLPVGPCATDWYCAASVCTYSCVPQPPYTDE